MDSTKTAIKSLVLDLRHTLEADLEVGLRRYGIASNRLRDLSELTHLDDRGLAERIRLEEALKHEMRRAGEPANAGRGAWHAPDTQGKGGNLPPLPSSNDNEKALAEAVHWFVREVAFTHLNRLVALKALEVRGLIPEVIQPRPEYGERSRALRDYRAAHPAAAGLADGGLEAALKEVCRQVYPEFRILFDVGDPLEDRPAPANSLLWPSTPVLKACIEKINALDGKIGRSGPPAHAAAAPQQSLWAEDEIIGWVYQFYNAEEKVAVRRRGKPARPAEVAVINQFFTPRWIVKFLVDNTLGRLWLEMHPDSPRVREKCDYLVPEPLAVSGQQSAFGDQQSAGGERKFALDQESPVNNPLAEARREAKKPQELRLIDPACGTMHFGHYAFEVFQEIYRDAREQGWATGADALDEADIPAAILRCNLYGVDIDLRAVQLAALSLFIKAKSAHPQATIERVNLVVADAYLPQGAVRDEFLAQYAGEPLIQKAFREVFAGLENVAEVGSLLRVEERFRQALEAGGYGAPNGKPRRGALPGQIGFSDLAPGWQPEYTIEQMLGHLRQFARRALQEHDLNAQLFAAETEKSVALLDVFLHEYDVVVMNPPYGDCLPTSTEYLTNLYPKTSTNLYSAFIDRAFDLTYDDGLIGALVSRTFLAQPLFTGLRKDVILTNSVPAVTIDLGFGILDDATVDTCATILQGKKDKIIPGSARCNFFRLDTEQDHKEKFVNILVSLRGTRAKSGFYSKTIAEFLSLPDTRFFYWAPNKVIQLFSTEKTLEPTYAVARQGLSSGNDKRFLRQLWEIEPNSIGAQRRWATFAKGGEYCRYYYDLDLVIYWQNDGEEIKEYARSIYGSITRTIKNQSYYFREGITYPNSSSIGFSARYMPPGAIISVKGQGLYPFLLPDIWWHLGLLNSIFIGNILDIIHPGKDYQAGDVKLIPVISVSDENKSALGSNAKEAFSIKSCWDNGNEICSHFTLPWLLQAARGELRLPGLTVFENPPGSAGLPALVERVLALEAAADAHLQALQAEIDRAVYALYEITPADQALIERELGRRPPEVVWPYAEKLSRAQKAAEHTARLISYCLLQAIRADPDGILPITPTGGHATALEQVRRGLEGEFGETAAYQVELDAAGYLGRPLAEWLERAFWQDYHIKWYRRRPVIWQVGSAKGHFAAFIYIHKLNRDTLPRLRTQYLWPARSALQADLENAALREQSGERAAAKEVARLEAALDDLADFETRLLSVIEGRVKCAIPAWAQGPFRNGMYDPVQDDGVAVNIGPLQEAGILTKKVV